MRQRLLLLTLLVLVAAWWAWPAPPAPVQPAPPERATAPPRVAKKAPPPAPPPPAGASLTRVTCSLFADLLPGTSVRVVEVQPDDLSPIADRWAVVDGDWFSFDAASADGLGWLFAPLHEPKAFAWVDGACTAAVEPTPEPRRRVEGPIEGPIEAGAVAVSARCSREGEAPIPLMAYVSPMDARYALSLPVEVPCELVVRRVFGGRDLFTEPVPLAASAQDQVVPLAVPDVPGIGVGGGWREDAITLYGVAPGSVADRAGLRAGDRVVAIDGAAPTADDLERLHERPGPFALEVDSDGERWAVEVREEG